MELTIEQALQQGIAAHKAGKLEEAEQFYRAILQLQPLHPDVNHNLGVIAVSLNKADMALPLFKNALEANPKIELFWLSYIDALIKEKQFDNAKQALKQAEKQSVAAEKLNVLKAQLTTIVQINEPKLTTQNKSLSLSQKLKKLSEQKKRKKKARQNLETKNPSQEQLTNLLKYYQNGRFSDAEKLAINISKDFPNHPFSWKVLGAVLETTGRKSEALDANQTAVALSPQDDAAHYNLGNTFKELGRFDEAIASYTKAIALKPDFAQAHYNLGNTLKELGRFDEAIASYTQAIALKPDYTKAHYNLGNTFKELGKFDEAIASYTQAIALKPDYAEAHSNLGITLQELERLDEAVASYTQAIALKPDYAEAHSNLGITLQELGKFDDALASYTQAIALKPDFAEAHSNLGVALQQLERLDEALASHYKAITLKPDYAEAHSNLGNTFKELGRLDDALASYTQAIALKPDFAEAYSNLGVALQQLERLDEALASHKKAIALKPDYTEAYYNLSFPYNLIGDFKKGLKLYESRLTRKKTITRIPRDNLIWDGKKSILDKKFFVYEEQGLGDVIQFCRYLILLKQKGAEVIFNVKPKMHNLLRTLSEDIVFVDKDPDGNNIDFETPLMSLPYLFNTDLKSIPSITSYLSADHDKIISWKKRLAKDTFKIGICWQGSKTKIDFGRSFPLTLFKDISKLPNVELISLHKGEGEKQIEDINFNLTVLSDDFDNGEDAFIDTAAVMANCDLIITSDTAIAHLAGALDYRTWVVLKKIPDWRWMLDRDDSPWYPNMRLYRQKERDNWEEIFEIIKKDLQSLLKLNEN